jgi:nitroreductase
MTDFFAIIKARKSVRSYQSRPVEDDKIKRIVESVQEAPNAGPYINMSVITNKSIIAEMNKKAIEAMKGSGNDFLISQVSIPGYQPLYGAPLIIIFSSPGYASLSAANSAVAATTGSYAATALGLASCYLITPTLAINADSELANRIGIADGNIAFAGLLIGYENPIANPDGMKKVVNLNFFE